MDKESLTLHDLVQQAYDDLAIMLEAYDLPEATESLAAFSIVYGVNTPDGDIAVGHATPTDYKLETPLVLRKIADVIHEDNVSEIGKNN